MRLDQYLVSNGHYESRNRANDAIKSGLVLVDGRAAKPSTKVSDDSEVTVIKSKFYISRAAAKLENFLSEYPMDLRDKIALDIGSSTGGFAQILLENNVKCLVCVDVGSNQLHDSLRDHEKIALHENMDIRDFTSSSRYELVTCDVSFISILQIVPSIDRLADSGSDIIILYKPQFEVGRTAKRDSKGVVQDTLAIETAKREFELVASDLSWQLKYQTLSKVQGKEGNQEYLYHFVKN